MDSNCEKNRGGQTRRLMLRPALCSGGCYKKKNQERTSPSRNALGAEISSSSAKSVGLWGELTHGMKKCTGGAHPDEKRKKKPQTIKLGYLKKEEVSQPNHLETTKKTKVLTQSVLDRRFHRFYFGHKGTGGQKMELRLAQEKNGKSGQHPR